MTAIRVAVVIMGSLLCCPLAVGHQDAIIEISRSGRLVGLPEQYGPASLELPRGNAPPETNVILRLGDKLIEFPHCISRLFREVRRRQISASASWYHDPEDLPYYLSIRLATRRSKYTYDGWSVLVALETAELISLEAKSQTDDGLGQNSQELDVHDICTPEEVKQLTPRQTD